MLLNSEQDYNYLNVTLGEVWANIMNEDFMHDLCYANNNIMWYLLLESIFPEAHTKDLNIFIIHTLLILRICL